MARLTSLASSRLSRKLARRVDAEDVVLSAWRSFFVATGRDQVDVPNDDNLWPLLVTMTLRKLSRQAARHTADRRFPSRYNDHQCAATEHLELCEVENYADLMRKTRTRPTRNPQAPANGICPLVS